MKHKLNRKIMTQVHDNKELFIYNKKSTFDVKQKEASSIYRNGLDNTSDQIIINACKTSDLNLIKEYLNSEYNVNSILETGWTLLLYAASYAQPNLIKYLLDFGANPNLHYEGYTPLMALCNSNRGSPEIRVKCLQHLVEGNADVNATNKIRETALMIACKMQEPDFVIELLKNDVLINFADGEQRTAIFYAVTNNRYEITKILIENGADITLTNYRGSTPYDVAITKGYENFLPLLKIDNDIEFDHIQIKNISSWMDMFPKMNVADTTHVDSDVENMLYGMRLESYTSCFYGISLKRFLKLKKDDLVKLGIDISVHRERFVYQLLRFHKQEWRDNLVKIDRTKPFHIFKTVIVLGNINKQLSVMSSSVYYSKICLDYVEADVQSDYSIEDKELLKNEIKNLDELIANAKRTTHQIKILTKVMRDENPNLSLPIYIGKENKRIDKKWMTMTCIAVTSICLFRIQTIKKLCNSENVLLTNWSNICNMSFAHILCNKFYRLYAILCKNFQI